MAVPATPTNLIAQVGNGQDFLSWDVTPTATSYSVERSLDNITFASVATPTLPEYLDTSVTLGTKYFYRVKAVNGDGPSTPTASQMLIPAPASEMSLYGLRLAAQQRADRLNSDFVTTQEWNSYVNQSMYELYDILVTTYEDYYVATPVEFTTTGVESYDLPNGTNYSAAPALYKLLGVDLGVNTSTQGWVTVGKFNFLDRNKYVYPNTASTLYGVFNVQYRQMGSKLLLIPPPVANQKMRFHYVPRLQQLLKDNDLTTIGISGWLEYVIVRAAKFALDKEESDSSVLTQEIQFLKQRIEESAANRDAGRPDVITDTRLNGFGGSGYGGSGWGSPWGGY